MRLAFLEVLGSRAVAPSRSSPSRSSASRVDVDARLQAAILVTDDRTRPLEFRLTEPLEVSALHATLHGDAMAEHVLADLLTAPLLRALRETPDWLLVRDEALLDLEAALVEKAGAPGPMLWIGRDTSAPEKAGGTVLGLRQRDSDADAARHAMRPIAARYDLLEPFARIDRALQQLGDVSVVGATREAAAEGGH